MSRLVYVILSLARVVMQRCFLFLPSKQRVQEEEDRFLSMPPKHSGRFGTGLLPIMLACQEEEKGLLLSIQHGGGGQSTRNQRRKQLLSPMLLEVKNNLPRSKDKKAPSNNWENASRDTSETTLSNNTKIHLLTILK